MHPISFNINNKTLNHINILPIIKDCILNITSDYKTINKIKPIELDMLSKVFIKENKFGFLKQLIGHDSGHYFLNRSNTDIFIKLSETTYQNFINNHLYNKPHIFQMFLQNFNIEDFIKIGFYHEMAHALDLLFLNNNLLVSKIKPKNQFKIQQILNNTQEKPIIGHFIKRQLMENIADCWSCYLLARYDKNISLSDVIKCLMDSRIYVAEKPCHIYATYHALNYFNLLYTQNNYNKYLNHSDWIEQIYTAAYQGLIKNLKLIVLGESKEEMKFSKLIYEYKIL